MHHVLLPSTASLVNSLVSALPTAHSPPPPTTTTTTTTCITIAHSLTTTACHSWFCTAMQFDAADPATDALCTAAATVGVPMLLAGGWTARYRGHVPSSFDNANADRSFYRAVTSTDHRGAQAGGPCWFASSRYDTIADYAAAHERDRGLPWSAGWDNCGTSLGSTAPWSRTTWPACALNGTQVDESRLYMLSGVASTAIAPPVELGDRDLAWAVVLDTSADAVVTLTFLPRHAGCGALAVSAAPGDAGLLFSKPTPLSKSAALPLRVRFYCLRYTPFRTLSGISGRRRCDVPACDCAISRLSPSRAAIIQCSQPLW